MDFANIAHGLSGFFTGALIIYCIVEPRYDGELRAKKEELNSLKREKELLLSQNISLRCCLDENRKLVTQYKRILRINKIEDIIDPQEFEIRNL